MWQPVSGTWADWAENLLFIRTKAPVLTFAGRLHVPANAVQPPRKVSFLERELAREAVCYKPLVLTRQKRWCDLHSMRRACARHVPEACARHARGMRQACTRHVSEACIRGMRQACARHALDMCQRHASEACARHALDMCSLDER